VCKEEGIVPLQLLKWGLNKFCRNADDSSSVPKLQKKEYRDYLLTRQEWELIDLIAKFAPVKDALEAGLAKLQKWHCAMGCSNIYFICLVLDPKIKTAYTSNKWDPDQHAKGMIDLENTVG
ncbi:hypothetical protein BC835DRAFT_1260465, partial [Cytidiella melzeri]